jgi:hypothetical protein
LLDKLQLRQLGIHSDPMGGGLPIKVSRGECADDFLLTVHPQIPQRAK